MADETRAFFECRRLMAAYDGVRILHGIDMPVAPGEMIGVIGPNGSGKTTLLKALSGTLTPISGHVLIDGREVAALGARERARMIAVVQQSSPTIFAFSVRDVVAMGRHSYLGPLQGLGQEDRDVIQWALDRTDCARFADRPVTELSGGELQRVIIARALTQQPRILLLDEPTNHLDINHQLQIGQLLRRLNDEKQMTILWVSHDVNLASEFCRRIVMIRDGRIIADGPPSEVVTEDMISELYGIHVPVRMNPSSGRPQVVVAAQAEALQ